MKLYSQKTEIRVIKTLTNARLPEATRSVLLAKLSNAHFHYPPTKAAFARISSFAKKKSRILDWDDLVEDATIDEEFREILQESDEKSAKDDQERISDMLGSLDNYRITRGIYAIAEKAVEKLKEKAVDGEKLLTQITNEITSIRQITNEEANILRIGEGDNSKDTVEEILYGESDPMILTGIPTIDETNGGLPIEGVHVMAATTSGGKSAVAMQLLVWIYLLNKMSVMLVSLEMGHKQVMQRLLSNLSGVLFNKIKKRITDKAEKEQIKQALKKFRKFGKKNECSYEIMCPTEDISMQKMLLTLQPYGFSVIVVDYVGIMEDAKAEDQWKALSEAVRQAKVFSRKTHSLIIVLAQLDSDDDRIRYSKGMLEHADCCWTWNYSKPEVRAEHVITVQPRKMRDGEMIPFELKEEFHVMRVSPMKKGDESGQAHSDDDDDMDLGTTDKKDDTGIS